MTAPGRAFFWSTLSFVLAATACGRSELSLDDLSPAGGNPVGGFAGNTGFGGTNGFEGGTGPDGENGFEGNNGFEGGAGFGGFDGSAGVAGKGGNDGASGHAGVAGHCDKTETSCTDKVDNDCNGLTDCQDPACFGTPHCACETSETSCSDGVDNDCNGLIDCKDPQCKGDKACACGKVEVCGNGKDDDCNGLTDCQDPACKADKACACAASETSCVDGVDNDCNGLIDCDDPGCANDKTCSCKQTPEDCSNGVDDNCNGKIDCADTACENSPVCACHGMPQPEVCDDGIDNDCNGLIDCQDPACVGSAACAKCTAEICNDGVDNNCNGLIDCADPACEFDKACAPTQEICDNGIDDNHNGKTDCDDPACFSNPHCLKQQQNCFTARDITGNGSYTGDTTGNPNETHGTCGGVAGEAVFRMVLTAPTRVHLDTDGSQFDTTIYLRFGSCGEGQELACNDDSFDSKLPPPAWPSVAAVDLTLLYPGVYYVFVDGYTVDANQGPDQGPFVLNVDLTPNPKEDCSNGVDDDGNVYIDCADPGCAGAPNCQCNGGKASAEYGVAACTDGVDNDCNGLTDAADKINCNANAYYATEVCNGGDDNGNQIVDEFACRCADDSTCGQGQICYTQTAHSCGPPCDQFVGDVCPFVAPGSTCNPGTGQCAF